MPHSDAGWRRRRFIVLFHVYLGGMTLTAMLQEIREHVMHVRRLASADLQSWSLGL